MALAKGAPLTPPTPEPITLASLLGEIREERGISKAQMARDLEVRPPSVTQFESHGAASAEMLLGYMRALRLTEEELEALTDRLASSLVSSVYDRRVDPLERALIADRLYRAMGDGYANRIRELIDGPCGTRTHVSAPTKAPDRRKRLSAIEGRPGAKPDRIYQTRLGV